MQPSTPQLSLSELSNLALLYSASYASPHHFVMSVNGLRNLLDNVQRQGQRSIATDFEQTVDLARRGGAAAADTLAAKPLPEPALSGTLVDSGCFQLAVNVLRRAGKFEVADELEKHSRRIG